MRRYTALIVFLLLVAGAAASGALYKPGPFYAALAKPAWTPPAEVFAPVWVALYIMIALAGWLIWRAQGLGLALWLWLMQLPLSAAWSWIMFGRKQVDWALIDIVALWLAVLAFVLAAWPVRRTASLLFVPYFLWVSFAGALNFAIWRLNS